MLVFVDLFLLHYFYNSVEILTQLDFILARSYQNSYLFYGFIENHDLLVSPHFTFSCFIGFLCNIGIGSYRIL